MDLNNKKRKSKVLFLIFVLTFLLYGNSIRNKYALDDNFVTVTTPERPNNPKIEKGIRGIPKIFTTHYIESKQQTFEYRPLVLTTFAIEYQFFGSNPHISHFINVLLFAITNCILLLILLLLLKGYNYIVPLVITGLFLVHPIHTEVVTNIKSRDELLSFLLGMCSLLFALKNIETKKIKFIIASALFIILALLCKKTALLFIPLIPLTYYFFYPLKTKQITYLLGAILISLICFSLFKKSMLSSNSVTRVYAFFENPLFYETNILNRIPLALYSIGYYIKLLVLPYPLCCYYGYSTIPFVDWSTPFVITSLFFHSAIFIYALKTLKQKNILSYSILVYLIGIFPFSNIVSLSTGVVGERFIYFASFGYCIAIACLLMMIFKFDPKHHTKKLKTSLSISLLIIFILHATLTISRNSNWKDEITLFRHDSKNFKNSCNLQYITGNKIYSEAFNTSSEAKRNALIAEATNHYTQALKLMEEGVKKYPKDYTTMNNIGTIYINIFNDGAKAHPYFKKSISFKPDDEITQFNDAFCYEKRNLPDSAIIYYEKLVLLKTKYVPVYTQLRELYWKKTNYAKAIECDKKAIEVSPLDARLYVNLGNSYMSDNDTLNGIIQFEQALEKEPGNTLLLNQITTFLNSSGYTEKAQELKKRFPH